MWQPVTFFVHSNPTESHVRFVRDVADTSTHGLDSPGNAFMKLTTVYPTLTVFLLSLSSGAALAADRDDAARITTIVGLTNIQQIGSTQNINDANGKPIMVDPD